MASIDRREYPVVRDGTYQKGTVQPASDANPGINPVLAEIPLREIKSTYRTRQPNVPFPHSDLFSPRKPGDELQTADKIQETLARGISIDWSSIPPDVVRNIVIKAIEESKTRLDLSASFEFLGGQTLQGLEEYVQTKEGNGRRDITYLLLADLSLLPSRGQIVVLYERVIDKGDPVPTYGQTARRLKVNSASVFKTLRKAGLLDKLKDQRKEAKNVVLPRSQEMAWLLGMLTGVSGVCSPKKRQTTFSNKNEYKLQAFKRSAERVFGEALPGIRGSKKILPSHAHPSVVFHNAIITSALGEFGRDTKPDTIRERHGWVLDDSYVASFASGLFDSGGHIMYDDIPKFIEFTSANPVVTDFYSTILIRLGMTRIRREIANFGGHNLTRIQVGTMRDLRTFAEKVTSVDPQTQEKLDKLKTIRRKRKRYLRINSPLQIVNEWERITEILGHTPSSHEIKVLVSTGQTQYNPEVYSRHFGRTSDGRKSFSAARDRLNSLMGSTDPAVLEEINAVELTGWKLLYSDQELLDEWVRIRRILNGRIPTSTIINQMYRAGRTRIDVMHYRKRFGHEGDGPPRFVVARRVIEELTNQNLAETVDEKHIFP